MAISKSDLLDGLWDKSQALYDFLEDLNDRLSAGDRPDFEGVIANAELEIGRIETLSEQIENDRQIPFPTDEQVKALAASTGALQKVVNVNAALEKMASAATALIKTWPVSKGG